jgi:hypothetical protein
MTRIEVALAVCALLIVPAMVAGPWWVLLVAVNAALFGALPDPKPFEEGGIS